jgi:hypothetical protein
MAVAVPLLSSQSHLNILRLPLLAFKLVELGLLEATRLRQLVALTVQQLVQANRTPQILLPSQEIWHHHRLLFIVAN